MSKVEFGDAIGDVALSAWQVAPGVTWVQTRNPAYARKLAKRSDARLVARGVAGGYLRTFEFIHPLSWAERLIARYTSAPMSANAGKDDGISPTPTESQENV